VADLPLAGRRILVVDDQAAIRSVLELALADAGADVRTAADGLAALELVALNPPELIMLDLAMPGMSGWQVLEKLQAATPAAQIPIVLQTSAEDYDSFDRAKKLRVAAFVSKPFRLAEVVETCRRILEGARPLQGRTEPPTMVPEVEVRDAADAPAGVGTLIDTNGDAAQVDLDRPLKIGQRVTLVLKVRGQSNATPAVVRWVSKVDNRFHHGLRLDA
jgi:two-component system, OmpR family, alkaline phosphatase synthesis response regulator PhoP